MLDKISEIPQQVKKITLLCQWQYRINGGLVLVTFDGDEDVQDVVDVSGSFARKAYNEGTTVAKLAKKVFTKQALKFIEDNSIEVVGVDGEVGDDLIYAEENSDS
jgi:hypothetical protein